MLGEHRIFEQDFKGGLFKRGRDFVAPKNTLSKMQNAIFRNGILQTRGGMTKLNGTTLGAASAHSLKMCYKNDATNTKYLVALTGAKIHAVNPSTGAWDELHNGTGRTANLYASLVVGFNQTVYMSDGTNPEQKWDFTFPGSTSNWSGVPPNKCQFLLPHEGRMLAWGMVGDQLYFSELYAPETWDPLAIIRVPEDLSPRYPRGMCHIPGTGEVCLLTQTSISILTGVGPGDWRLQTLPEFTEGNFAPRSLCECNGVVFYLGRSGVYRFVGGRPISISQGIQDWIDDINPTYRVNAFFVAQGHYLWCFWTSTAVGGAVNNVCFVWDDRNKIWCAGPLLVKADSGTVKDGYGDNEQVMVGTSNATGFIYQFDSSAADDDAVAIDTQIETPALALPSRMWLEGIEIKAPVQTGKIIGTGYYLDEAGISTSTGNISLDGTGAFRGDEDSTQVTRTVVVHPMHFSRNATADFVKFVFTEGNTPKKQFRMDGLKVFARPSGR